MRNLLARLGRRERRCRASGEGAFTLIELLIVVAIIAILAAIAVPNFLEAQTRAKVSRVHNDARTIVTGLEAYAVDFGRYPPRQKATTAGGGQEYGLVNTRQQDIGRLTTPISYLSLVPVDVFENRIAFPLNTLDYWSADIVTELVRDFTLRQTTQYGWAVLSMGPDGLLGGLTPATSAGYPVEPTILGATVRFDYDPTNGTLSPGNIYRFQNGANGTRVFQNN